MAAVAPRETGEEWSAQDSLAELAQLAGTAGVEVVGQLIQRLPVPSKTHYLGKGKLDELEALKSRLNYSVVIIDDELSPIQQHNLEEALGVKVIDRAALILDVFARRARTREGQIQVELAQHQYLLPRLAGQWSHLERLGGGIGTRGPGESQLETDRRLIRRKIQRLEKQIEEVRKHRRLYREQRKRSGIPMVALVGYTNTGKSTLLNALSHAGVFVEDKLFATLDPTTRRITLPGRQAVLVTDTVGFIRKLPPAIATAFRATLEELDEADMLVNVVDITSQHAAVQYRIVENTLRDLGLLAKPVVTALNKIDRLWPDGAAWQEEEVRAYLARQHLTVDENTVFISAARGWGLDRLLERITLRLVRTKWPGDQAGSLPPPPSLEEA
ncbi:MAG: GTPase HflX [Chloroflexota bacterium]